MFISLRSVLISEKFFKFQPVLINKLQHHDVSCLKVKMAKKNLEVSDLLKAFKA